MNVISPLEGMAAAIKRDLVALGPEHSTVSLGTSVPSSGRNSPATRRRGPRRMPPAC
jgi:hypothetical protein